MASNSFGQIFKITTWGESHGPAVGVVIDGCPAGLPLKAEEIDEELSKRSPGKSPYTSPRKEEDSAEILSGVFEGFTTGAPISILVKNGDADGSKYEPIKDLLRPGHANFTYLEKYGVFDYRGGGRASARETVCRVAAGAVAKKLLVKSGISLITSLVQVGEVVAKVDYDNITPLQNSLFCLDEEAAWAMAQLIEKSKAEGDSLGGVVEFVAFNVPVGLGDPVYSKLEANLAFAMMGLPASKGFEMGSGFSSVTMKGSEHADPFVSENGHIKTTTNYAGGTLGGISTGMPVIGRVAFKPPSSVAKALQSTTVKGETALFELPAGSRHDPCVAIRAVPVVEAMFAIVLADAILINRCSRL